ncbi:MAG: hypothetical protein ACLQMO_13885 [Acidobacteriaceae bacterium]
MDRHFTLRAQVRSVNAEAIHEALAGLVPNGHIRNVGNEFIVEAEMEGASAKDLNRTLLSALRRIEKRTTLRAEWTSGNLTQKFFDYVLKKTIEKTDESKGRVDGS